MNNLTSVGDESAGCEPQMSHAGGSATVQTEKRGSDTRGGQKTAAVRGQAANRPVQAGGGVARGNTEQR